RRPERERWQGGAAGDEVEPVVRVDAEAEVQRERDRDGGDESRVEPERRDAEVDGDLGRFERERLPEREVELGFLRIEDVDAGRVLVVVVEELELDRIRDLLIGRVVRAN